MEIKNRALLDKSINKIKQIENLHTNQVLALKIIALDRLRGKNSWFDQYF